MDVIFDDGSSYEQELRNTASEQTFEIEPTKTAFVKFLIKATYG